MIIVHARFPVRIQAGIWPLKINYNHMKNTALILISFLLIQANVFAQNSWKSPEYVVENYRKVIVLSKTTDELTNRLVEDTTVKLLKEKGIDAIAAYSNITDSDLATEEAFLAKADMLGIDALVVYNYVGNNTEYKNKPSVDASLGIPVRLGIFSGFLGTNVPIAGGSKVVETINATATFYNRSSKSMQWSIPLSGTLKNDNKLSATFAKKTVNTMIKDNLF